MSKIAPDQENTNSTLRKMRVLVAPLDWGLGHATRCIPIIYELIKQGADVWLAADGAPAHLLHSQFPQLPLLPLQGYHVRYSKRPKQLTATILAQLPRISRRIGQEHTWLQQQMKEHAFDIIISDNRYGLYTPGAFNILITHQLQIQHSWGKWVMGLLRRWHYRRIGRFQECWVPDLTGQHSLAGQLSHPAIMPNTPVHYIGHLSRLQPVAASVQPGHLFVSLSGPEPQRTLLEEKIIDQVSHYPGTATITRGLPHASRLIPSTGDIRFYNHLPADEYAAEMQRAEFVISRSGYSTVMDIARMGKKSILIPTPGQPEQEYLGKYLQEKQRALCFDQHSFELTAALQQAKEFSYQLPAYDDTLLAKHVQRIVSSP